MVCVYVLACILAYTGIDRDKVFRVEVSRNLYPNLQLQSINLDISPCSSKPLAQTVKTWLHPSFFPLLSYSITVSLDNDIKSLAHVSVKYNFIS